MDHVVIDENESISDASYKSALDLDEVFDSSQHGDPDEEPPSKVPRLQVPLRTAVMCNVCKKSFNDIKTHLRTHPKRTAIIDSVTGYHTFQEMDSKREFFNQ